MRIIKHFVSILIASSISISAIPKRVEANPAVLAPVAICSTGVGCILVGTVVVGSGIVYYIWQHNNKRIISDGSGAILQYLDDPESDDVGVWEDPLDTPSYPTASKICNGIAKRLGAQLVEIKRHPVTGKLSCIFRGGSGQ